MTARIVLILKEDIENSTQQMCREIKLQEYFRYKTFRKIAIYWKK